ncbi:MAG: gliding motility-associated C-terminal domain-containing protein, partial [Phaeodactylibacter sp.]|nr:gliding motility-associated C-terminal domain-containing protein [Phaeodactylibacter sp.]
ELGNLENLSQLLLNSNRLSGDLPPELGNLSNLSELVLSTNLLSGIIPSELGNLSNLTHLQLDDNQLSGTIPPALGNLGNLTHLLLAANRLTGTIPLELGNLSALKFLDLSSNLDLNGGIPAGFGGLQNLITLNLADNELSGPIPPELGNLANLTGLELQINQLSGNIPASLGNLSNVGLFWLYNNQLSGPIPDELGSLPNLSSLMLQNNNLSGCFPPELDNHCAIDVDFSNNPRLPWQGDFSRFCIGDPQLGASCNDGDDGTAGEVIQADCGCRPDFACPMGTTVIVTNTNDSGPGSLRQAIECTNADPALDSILFEIPGAGPHIIFLLSALPAVSDEGVVIDGLSQDSNIGSIVIDGNGVVNDGLYLAAGLCTVRGIKARNFNSSGFIIFDVNSCVLDQNCTVNNFYGIFIGRGSLCNDHTITNNLIGVDENGGSGSNRYGVQIFGCSNNLLMDNTIAYNSLVGLGHNGGGNEGNQIIRGSFFCNAQGIFSSQAVNIAPEITLAQTDIIQGITDVSETVAVYRQDNFPCGTAACQGAEFLGIVTADAEGNWTLFAPFSSSLMEGDQLTATTTAQDGSTSPFSACVLVGSPCPQLFTFQARDTICEGESYPVADLSYGQTGQYQDTIRYSNGCDSLLVNLDLVVLDEATLGAAAAVGDESDCEGRAFLSGNLPPLASGRWETNSGAILNSPDEPSTTVSNMPVGESVFSWILSAGQCPDYDTSMVRLHYQGAPLLQDDDIELAFARGDYLMNVLANDEWQIGDELLVLGQPATGQAFFDTDGELVFSPVDFVAGAQEFIYALCRQACCDTARVRLLIERPVGFPDAITPNGDGYNDFFVIQPLFESPASFPENRLLIFERSGSMVFEASPYRNDWEGRNQRGKELPEGSYYFIYEPGDGTPKVTGRIAVFR